MIPIHSNDVYSNTCTNLQNTDVLTNELDGDASWISRALLTGEIVSNK